MDMHQVSKLLRAVDEPRDPRYASATTLLFL